MAIIKSKYEGYGEVRLSETDHDYDFIAVIENTMEKTLKVFIDDLEGWYSDPVVILPHDRVGFLADEEGQFLVESIKNGDFQAVYE